jgi:serine phosphatase RsbU (regulator of sigma subunit)
MRWILNTESLYPKTNGKTRSRGERHDFDVPPHSIMSSISQQEQDEVQSLRREKLDLHAQLFEAAQIQRKLSGPRESRHGCLQFASEVFAARFLSGDFVTFLQNGVGEEHRIFAVHGDIAGKGVAAGMWFTNLAGLLQSYGHSSTGPEKVAAAINRQLCRLRPIAPFVTAFLAQIDCQRGELTCCNAGQFPPILVRSNGQTALLETGGPLLGAIEDAEFHAEGLTLEPGDVLVVYSDGVLECRNASGEEFGLDRILESVRCAKQQSAHATLMTLLSTLQDFSNGGPLCDDVSLTIIQRSAQISDTDADISGTPASM